MAKRKADIFTVVESVVNWFEASSPNIALVEIPEGVVNQSEFGGTGTGQSSVAGPIANEDEASQQALPLSPPTNEAANYLEATQKCEESAGAAGLRGHDDVGGPRHPTPSELAESAAAAHQAFGALLKRAGYEEW